MEDFKMNFKNSYENRDCEYCQDHEDNQSESLKCKVVHTSIEDTDEGIYEDIYKETIPRNIITTMTKIINKRKMMK